MSRHYKNDDVSDDVVTGDEEELAEDEDDEEEEESPIETIVKEIMEKYHVILDNYVSDPNSPEDVSQNDSIKKFVKLKVRAKLMESFECMQHG